jgi:hypothetical protein
MLDLRLLLARLIATTTKSLAAGSEIGVDVGEDGARRIFDETLAI